MGYGVEGIYSRAISLCSTWRMPRYSFEFNLERGRNCLGQRAFRDRRRWNWSKLISPMRPFVFQLEDEYEYEEVRGTRQTRGKSAIGRRGAVVT